jgi:esterase/lipase
MLNNNNNTDVILQAINGTDADVRQLATTLNADLNFVRGGIDDARMAIANVAAQTGLSSLQVQNAILSGDASIVSKLQECCCENRLLTTQQGYEARIQTIEQTNQLGSQADRNTKSITDAISAQTIAMNDQFCALKERELQNKIDSLTAANTNLRNQIDNAAQTAAVASMLAPIQKEVSEIKAAQPATVTVQWPQLTAIPSYMLYGNGSYYGGYPYYGSGSIWA